MTVLDVDAVVAVADLAARAGARSFEIGYTRDPGDDGYTEHGPGWYASAFYRGARVIVDEKASPDEAADGLARRLLDGGQCTRCGAPVSLGEPATGKRRCRWRRMGETWVRGCDGKARATRGSAS